jgi:hypothetical protein
MTRTVLTGQMTGVFVKSSNPCSLVATPGIMKLTPLVTNKGSAPSYPTGTFYDRMEPLTSNNCQGMVFAWVPVNASMRVGTAQVNITKKQTLAPAKPRVNLHADFNNWTMVLGYGGSGVATGADALPALQLLSDFKISPYKGVESPTLADWNKYTVPFALGSVYMDWGTPDGWLATAPRLADSWVYIQDEPAIGSTAGISTALTAWAATAPWVKPMLTTPLRQRDYRTSSPNYGKTVAWPADVTAGVKIWVPVAEQLCQETWRGSGDFYPCPAEYASAGKELWTYVSNMSHGNEGSAASGAPDLVIDRSAVEVFGFYLLALKHDIRNLLYYNTIEGWSAFPGRDVNTNPYQFGGWGDGLLLYPDRAKKQAYPSARLALIREASQWVDIIMAAGLEAEAKALMTNSLTWNRSLAAFEALRTKALGLLP